MQTLKAINNIKWKKNWNKKNRKIRKNITIMRSRIQILNKWTRTEVGL